MHRLGSPSKLFSRAGDIERYPGPKRALPMRGRDVSMQDILPTTAQHNSVAAPEFEKCLQTKNIHGPEEVVSHGLNDTENAGLYTMRLSCAMSAFKQFCCIPLPLSFVDRVAGMVAEWFSAVQTAHLSVRLKERVTSAGGGARARSVGLSRMIMGPHSATNGNTKHQQTS